MNIKKDISEHLKKDGIHLGEEELHSIIRFLNSLAKIEYEVYRQQNSTSVNQIKTINNEQIHN